MKSILILTNSSIGLVRFRKELITALGQSAKVVVSSPNDGFGKEIQSLGATFIETNYDRRGSNPLFDFILCCRYCFIIRKIEPSVILTYTHKPNIYGNFAARLFNRPVITTVTGTGDTFLRGGMIGSIVKVLYRFALKSASCVVFQNNEDEEILRRLNVVKGQNTVHVPGSGVNISEHVPLEYPADGAVSFLFIGRLMRSKGIGELIAATRRLKAELPDAFSVTLMGASEGDMDDMIEKAKNDRIVTTVGFQKDVVPFIKSAHCIVIPSYKEGMCNGLLEAAANARPLITTDVTGCREIVEDGVGGFICQPKDSDSLYECMKRFVNLPQEEKIRLGREARKKIEKEFDRNIVVEAMVKEINIRTDGS